MQIRDEIYSLYQDPADIDTEGQDFKALPAQIKVTLFYAVDFKASSLLLRPSAPQQRCYK